MQMYPFSCCIPLPYLSCLFQKGLALAIYHNGKAVFQLNTLTNLIFNAYDHLLALILHNHICYCVYRKIQKVDNLL